MQVTMGSRHLRLEWMDGHTQRVAVITINKMKTRFLHCSEQTNGEGKEARPPERGTLPEGRSSCGG